MATAFGIFGVIGTICSIISLLLYIKEKSLRSKQAKIFQGFLIGIASHTESAAQAGEEWRFNCGKGTASPNDAITYANSQVNWFISINKKIGELLSKIEMKN